MSSTCFKCPECESWHPDIIGVRQHINRRHQRPLQQGEEDLQSCLCSQTGPRRSYLPVSVAVLAVAPDNFRTQSLFAQRSLFGQNVPGIDAATMLTYFPPISGLGLIASIRREVKEFLNWIEDQCFQEWSLDLRNRMVEHGFKPIQSISHPKYIAVISAFCYFCRHCEWTAAPRTLSVGNIMWAALSEAKGEIRMMYMVEKFFFYSYHCMGRGKSSRDLPFFASECAYLKYGLRGGFLHYCLTILDNTNVTGLQAATATLKRSEPGAFVQLTSLKNIATSCIPISNHQHISWNGDSNFSSLTVLSVGVTLSHHMIATAFAKVCEFVEAILDAYQVEHLSIERFKTLKDSPTSTHAGEGLVVFNPRLFPGHQTWMEKMSRMNEAQKKDFFNDSYACANHLVVGLHLSAGPGFRGTEDASITLVNSLSQAPRNIRATGMGDHLQICLIPEYCKQRPLSMKRPHLIAKFLPVRLALLLIRYMILMKSLEGTISSQRNNCATFLVTNCGHPVNAGTYNQVLNEVFRSVGLGVDLANLRHGLEAFARHLSKVEMDDLSVPLKRNRLFANHSASASAGYSRDDFTVAQIDADILQQDELASHVWNTVILKSSNRLSDLDDPGKCHTVKKMPAGRVESQNGSLDLSSQLLSLTGHQALQPAETKSIQVQDFLHAPVMETRSPLPPLQSSSLLHGVNDRNCSSEALGERLITCCPLPAGDPSTVNLRAQSSQGHQTAVQLSQVQVESIQFLSSVREDSAVIMPTGSGKTRIIQVFGEDDSHDGVVIVITPFQKLGVQLLDVLGEKAFRWPLTGCSESRCIAQARFIVTAIEHCEYNSNLIQFLKTINHFRGISKIFLDEVHHLLEAEKPDFRPCLGSFWTFRRKLLTVDVHALVVGLTATLRTSDVPRLKELISGTHGTMPSFRRSCYRSSVQFKVGWTQTDSDAQEVCIKECLDFAGMGKIIVFATTIDVVNMLAQRMDCQAVTSGIAIDFERFDKRRIIVASSCAGHGLDMKDIYAVPILGVPFDAETLMQWAGRIRKSGFVKLFLNRRLVASLSSRVDRRGELAKVLIETAESRLQESICRLLDEGHEKEGPCVELTTGHQWCIFEWRVTNCLMIAVQVPCSTGPQHRGQSYYQVTIHCISFRIVGYQLVYGMYTQVSQARSTLRKKWHWQVTTGLHTHDRLTAVNLIVHRRHGRAH